MNNVGCVEHGFQVSSDEEHLHNVTNANADGKVIPTAEEVDILVVARGFLAVTRSLSLWNCSRTAVLYLCYDQSQQQEHVRSAFELTRLCH